MPRVFIVFQVKIPWAQWDNLGLILHHIDKDDYSPLEAAVAQLRKQVSSKFSS